MERVEGEKLRKLLGAGPMPLKKLLAVATQIAEGLAKAHETGIVHRDLKPENLMVTREGTVKILDFGLAKLTAPTDESGERTQSPTVSAGTEAGVVLGTVGYMSPEQALGEPLDFRSDQFAFGSILYEMVSGRRAFARASAPETMAAIIREEPAPLATAAPETPIPLRWIVERCLAKDREERYAATKDLAHDLARLREGLSGGSLSAAAIAAPAARGPDAYPRPGGGRRPRRRDRHRHRRDAKEAGVPGVPPADVSPRGDLHCPFRARRRDRPVHRRLAGTSGAALFDAPRQHGVHRAPAPERNLILSISGSGKLAILLDRNPPVIAEASLAGGAPRELVETQWSPGSGGGIAADWEPGGDRLAVVRAGRLEFPVGKVLVPASAEGRVHALRFSPDGHRIAFLQKRGRIDSVGVVDLTGKKTILSDGWERRFPSRGTRRRARSGFRPGRAAPDWGSSSCTPSRCRVCGARWPRPRSC